MTLSEELLRLSPDQQQDFLQAKRAALQDRPIAATLAQALKQKADRALRANLSDTEHYADLLDLLAQLSDDARHHALALRVRGNVAFFSGDYANAVTIYDEAAAIYRQLEDEIEAANSQIGKVVCLAYLDRSAEAIEVGEAVRRVLASAEKWQSVIALLMNLLVVYELNRQETEALQLLNEARALCVTHNIDVHLAGIELNRSIVLFHLGKLSEAEQAAISAETAFTAQDNPIPAARARHNRALALFAQGHTNESLLLFDDVRNTYLADNRHEDAIWVDLYVTDCLLQLGRYADVLQRCQPVRERFAQLSVNRELATVLVNEAIAYAGLKQFDAALNSFAEAQDSAETDTLRAIIQLERAAILLEQRQFDTALATANECRTIFATHQLGLRVAQANTIAGRAAIALGNHVSATDYANRIEGEATMPAHHLQAAALLGDIASAQHDWQTARSAYDRALAHLEQLRGRLMVEFRADYLQDQQRLYGAAVKVALAQNDHSAVVDYVERAKSRALVTLIANQLDLSVQPRNSAARQSSPQAESDEHALITQLEQWQADRNALYRRWSLAEDRNAIRQELLYLEQAITAQWHKLLLRNADYARDAALTTVRREPIQPHLDANTLLLEFFAIDDQLLVILITNTTIKIVELGSLRRLAMVFRKLNLNLKAASTSPPERIPRLTQHAKTLLRQLHQHLFAPIASQLAPFSRLLIVPHGATLHYLPFHALYDGQKYVAEQYQITQLPSASLLHYLRTPSTARQFANCGAVQSTIFGHSNNNLLPHAIAEAQAIHHLLGGDLFIEDAATRQQVEAASHAPILHLATHGDFNQANPLFSGLALADGQLSTLDIFNLRLEAELVTLSACQTGRSVVKGGDELLGLMRAFLYAGARKLLLSHWRVNDLSTLEWMQTFYTQVARGHPIATAIQMSQMRFIMGNGVPDHYAHPYFWSPFFLVGA